MLEMIAAFGETCGHEIPYTIAPRRPGDLPEVYADTELAEKELGWKAEFGLKVWKANLSAKILFCTGNVQRSVAVATGQSRRLFGSGYLVKCLLGIIGDRLGITIHGVYFFVLHYLHFIIQLLFF